jgi:hypothetical protein
LVPDIVFTDSPGRALAYVGKLAYIYELANPADYYSASGCRVSFSTRDSANVDCGASGGTLKRLEAYDEGWKAFVNGRETPVSTVDDMFQSIPLPPGEARVEFCYAPPWLRPSLIALALGILYVVGVCISVGRRGSHLNLLENIPD